MLEAPLGRSPSEGPDRARPASVVPTEPETVRVRLRPLGLEDLPTLARWLSDPAVSAFYTESADVRKLEHKLAPRIRGEGHVRPQVLVWEGRDVGYGQYYLLPEAERWALALGPDAVWGGFDLYLGEADTRGRGVGLPAVRTLLAALAAEGAGRVAVDTWVENRAAIRCYERAGLRVVRRLPRYERWHGFWRNHWLLTGDTVAESATETTAGTAYPAAPRSPERRATS